MTTTTTRAHEFVNGTCAKCNGPGGTMGPCPGSGSGGKKPVTGKQVAAAASAKALAAGKAADKSDNHKVHDAAARAHDDALAVHGKVALAHLEAAKKASAAGDFARANAHADAATKHMAAMQSHSDQATAYRASAVANRQSDKANLSSLRAVASGKTADHEVAGKAQDRAAAVHQTAADMHGAIGNGAASVASLKARDEHTATADRHWDETITGRPGKSTDRLATRVLGHLLAGGVADATVLAGLGDAVARRLDGQVGSTTARIFHPVPE